MYIVIGSRPRSICWFCTPAISIGFGVAPAPRSRARAASSCASISRSDADAASAAPTTEWGLFQSIAFAFAAISSAPATQAKSLRYMNSSQARSSRANEP
jgi:hypothetical protein